MNKKLSLFLCIFLCVHPLVSFGQEGLLNLYLTASASSDVKYSNIVDDGLLPLLRSKYPDPNMLKRYGFSDQNLKNFGYTLYPPAWDAFQTELSAMDRRAVYGRLSGGDALFEGVAPRNIGAGESVSVWFARALDEKFRTQEDLKTSAAERRPQFDPFIDQLLLEEAVLAHQAGLPHANLTDEQKYRMAEQMVVHRLAPIPALKHVIFGDASFMIRGIELTEEILDRMNGAPYPNREEASDLVKRGAYTQEVRAMFGDRLEGRTGEVITRMVATDATADSALLHIFGNEFELAGHNYAPDMVEMVRSGHAANIDQAFRLARENHTRTQYAHRLEGVAWLEEFVAAVVDGRDINGFLGAKFETDIRDDIRDAVDQFNSGTSYLQVVKNIKVQRVQEIVRGTFGSFTEEEQKEVATVMVQTESDNPVDALGRFLGRSYDAAVITEIMGQISPAHTLNDAINTVTFGPIRARYRGLSDREAQSFQTLMKSQALGVPLEEGLFHYLSHLNKIPDTLNEYRKRHFANRVGDHLRTHPLRKAIEKETYIVGQIKFLESLRAFDGVDLLPLAERMEQLRFGLGDEEARTHALREHIAAQMSLNLSFFQGYEMASGIAKKLLEEHDRTIEGVHRSFTGGIVSLTEGFLAWDLAYDDEMRSLLNPLLISGNNCLRIQEQEEGGFIGHITHMIARYCALSGKTFFFNPTTEEEKSINKSILMEATKSSLLEDVRFSEERNPSDILKNKLRRNALTERVQRIVSLMWAGDDMPYEAAQARADLPINAPQIKGAFPILDGKAVDPAFFPLTEIPADITALNPEHMALLKDFLSLYLLDPIEPFSREKGHKLATLVIKNTIEDRATLTAFIDSLVVPKVHRYVTWGIPAEEAPVLAEEAVFSSESTVSDYDVLRNYFFGSPEHLDGDGTLTPMAAAILHAMIKYQLNYDQSSLVSRVQDISDLNYLELPRETILWMVRHNPDPLKELRNTNLGLLQGPLNAYLRTKGIAEDLAPSIVERTIAGNSFVEVQLDVLSCHYEGLLSDELTGHTAGKVYDPTVGYRVGRLLLRRNLGLNGPMTLAVEDFAGNQHTLYEQGYQMLTNQYRIQGLMFKYDLAYNGTEQELEPLMIQLLSRGLNLGAVTQEEVQTAQLVGWFQNRPELGQYKENTEGLIKFAQAILSREGGLEGFRAIPPAQWLGLYNKANKVLPPIVQEFDDVVRAAGARIPGLRAARDAAIAGLPAITEHVQEGVNEAEAPVAIRQEILWYPNNRRYDAVIRESIHNHTLRPGISKWSLNWDILSSDPYAPHHGDLGEIPEGGLETQYQALRTMGLNNDGLDRMIGNASQGGYNDFYKRTLSKVLQAMTTIEKEKQEMALGICSEIQDGACFNRHYSAVGALSELVLGTNLTSLELKIHHLLKMNRHDDIERVVMSTEPPFTEIAEMEQKNWLKIALTHRLGLGFPNVLEHFPSVRVGLLDSDSVPNEWPFNFEGYNNAWRFNAVLDRILSRFTVDNMIRALQESIAPHNTRSNRYFISCDELTQFAQKSSMLWEYVFDGNSLWDEETSLVKEDVVGVILYQLGYVNPREGAELPECWPTLRRQIPRGTGEDVWVGTEPR